VSYSPRCGMSTDFLEAHLKLTRSRALEYILAATWAVTRIRKTE
jgi:hypothetical protein